MPLPRRVLKPKITACHIMDVRLGGRPADVSRRVFLEPLEVAYQGLRAGVLIFDASAGHVR